jgi:hypothetical protein
MEDFIECQETFQSRSHVRAALHLEARPIPLEIAYLKIQPFLGWRMA